MSVLTEYANRPDVTAKRERLHAHVNALLGRHRRVAAFASKLGAATDRIVPTERLAATRNLAMAGTATDSLATWLWLHLELTHEANPVVAYVLETTGTTTGLVLRTLWSVAAIWLLAEAGKTVRAGRHAMLVAVTVTSAVVMWHAALAVSAVVSLS